MSYHFDSYGAVSGRGAPRAPRRAYAQRPDGIRMPVTISTTLSAGAQQTPQPERMAPPPATFRAEAPQPPATFRAPSAAPPPMLATPVYESPPLRADVPSAPDPYAVPEVQLPSEPPSIAVPPAQPPAQDLPPPPSMTPPPPNGYAPPATVPGAAPVVPGAPPNGYAPPNGLAPNGMVPPNGMAPPNGLAPLEEGAPPQVQPAPDDTMKWVGLGLLAAAVLAGGWYLFARKKKGK